MPIVISVGLAVILTTVSVLFYLFVNKISVYNIGFCYLSGIWFALMWFIIHFILFREE
jgi:hypothetical protein